ncbi:MAG: hypothetical protein ABIU63_03540 [Chitinophagaceae bacterium]
MKIEMLAIGRNEEILQTLVRLINKNEQWNGVGAGSDEAAMRLFDEVRPSIILLSNGIDAVSEEKLRRYFAGRHPAVSIIQHYGGGSGLLTNEILMTLDANNRALEEG